MIRVIKKWCDRQRTAYHKWRMEETILNHNLPMPDRLRAFKDYTEDLPPRPDPRPLTLPLYTHDLGMWVECWGALRTYAQGVGHWPHSAAYLSDDRRDTLIEDWAHSHIARESLRGVSRDAAWRECWSRVRSDAGAIGECYDGLDSRVQARLIPHLNNLLADAVMVCVMLRKGGEVRHG